MLSAIGHECIVPYMLIIIVITVRGFIAWNCIACMQLKYIAWIDSLSQKGSPELHILLD